MNMKCINTNARPSHGCHFSLQTFMKSASLRRGEPAAACWGVGRGFKGFKRERFEEIRKEEERQKRADEENKKALAEKLAEEQRINEENRRIKEWEKKFDEEQKKKEEELIKKFYSQELDYRNDTSLNESKKNQEDIIGEEKNKE